MNSINKNTWTTILWEFCSLADELFFNYVVLTIGTQFQMISFCMHLTMDFAIYFARDPIHLHLIPIFQYVYVPKTNQNTLFYFKCKEKTRKRNFPYLCLNIQD